MRRFFLIGLGDTCYDDTGITYPQKIKINLVDMIKKAGGKNIRWAKLYSMFSMPKVITFAMETEITNWIAKCPDDIRKELDSMGLYIALHWTHEKD